MNSPSAGVRIKVRLPRPVVQAMDEMVRAGDFVDRADCIRHALRLLKEKHGC